MKKGVVGRQQGVGRGEEIRARHLGKKIWKWIIDMMSDIGHAQQARSVWRIAPSAAWRCAAVAVQRGLYWLGGSFYNFIF